MYQYATNIRKYFGRKIAQQDRGFHYLNIFTNEFLVFCKSIARILFNSLIEKGFVAKTIDLNTEFEGARLHIMPI